ncbi:hypothetical protein ZIOFF_000974 [Zingiber officinale]|uniref:F-box domain-containing protein n=1 Tax=Zingiber officinale TaxID=94328 RepID=A0A8J5IKZ7_ZINOF|nr:hypothetical protein ZIOFF_000974 [Zingiber officinale]
MAQVTDDGGGTNEAGATRDWSELTPVCLTNVFHRLTLEDRWKGTMLVSRSWRDASRDPSLFVALDLEPMFEFAGSCRSDCAEWWTPAFQRRVDGMLRSAALWAEGSLQEIRVRHCSDDSLCFAAERFSSSNLLWEAEFDMTCNLTYLQFSVLVILLLPISSFWKHYDDPHDYNHRETILPVLQSNSPGNNNRIQVINVATTDKCVFQSPNLQILTIKSSQSVTDRSMFKIASSCPMLVELDISNCYEVSFKSIEVVGKECPNLKVLKRNFLNWLDPSQHSGIVPNDYLGACPQDGDREAMTIAKFMPKLKHVELRFSKLSVRGLVSLSEGCRDLEFLDISGCANLTCRGIKKASAYLKNLKTFIRPNFYIPRSVFNTERYGHWRLYDERFQTNVFQL